jgi:molybdopterin biosynthesis enzyme MoaB
MAGSEDKEDNEVKQADETVQEADEEQVHVLGEQLESLRIKDEDAPESLRKVAKWIKDGHCQRILVLSGAGVSVSAGIPDFRTPGTGL